MGIRFFRNGREEEYKGRSFEEIAKDIMKLSTKRNKGIDWDTYAPKRKTSIPRALWEELFDFLRVELKDDYPWQVKMMDTGWKRDGEVAIEMFWSCYIRKIILNESRIPKEDWDKGLFVDLVSRKDRSDGLRRDLLNVIIKALEYEWKELEKIPNVAPYGPWRDDYKGDEPLDIPKTDNGYAEGREPSNFVPYRIDKENWKACNLDNRGHEIFEIFEVIIPEDSRWVSYKKRWYDPLLLIQNKTHFQAATIYFKTVHTQEYINTFLWNDPKEQFGDHLEGMMHRLKSLVDKGNPNNTVKDSTYELIATYMNEEFERARSLGHLGWKK